MTPNAAAAALAAASGALTCSPTPCALPNVQASEGHKTVDETPIAADPSKPVPYYLKGQALLAKGTPSKKDPNKIEVPQECIDAYKKYLSLDPNGPMSADVKAVMPSLVAAK